MSAMVVWVILGVAVGLMIALVGGGIVYDMGHEAGKDSGRLMAEDDRTRRWRRECWRAEQRARKKKQEAEKARAAHPVERHFTIGLQPGWTLRDIEQGIARFYAENRVVEHYFHVGHLTFGSSEQRRHYLGLVAESHREYLAFEKYGYAPLFVSPSVSAETVRVTFREDADGSR